MGSHGAGLVPGRSTGLVLGRFQLFHPGHRYLIDTAFAECGRVKVLVGSAQLEDPYSGVKRVEAVTKYLDEAYKERDWEVTALVDPEPMAGWVGYIHTAAGAVAGRFYRADRLSEGEESELHALGYTICYVERVGFVWKDPGGATHTSRASSEIKRILTDGGFRVDKMGSTVEGTLLGAEDEDFTKVEVTDQAIAAAGWRDEIKAHTEPGWIGVGTPRGWDGLVYQLCEQIKERCGEFTLFEAKEKFGELRLNCSVNRECRDLIDRAKVKSRSVCQVCSRAGERSKKAGPIRVLCEACDESSSDYGYDWEF